MKNALPAANRVPKSPTNRTRNVDPEQEVLRIAASLEQGSEHPLAQAIVTEAKRRALELSKPDRFDAKTGRGVVGTVDGKQVALGNTVLMEETGTNPTSLTKVAEGLRRDGTSVIMIMAIVMKRKAHLGVGHRLPLGR